MSLVQFAFLVGSTKFADALGLNPSSETVTILCSSNGDGDDPVEDQHGNSKCCGYCLANVRAASVLVFALIYNIAADLIPRAGKPIHRWDFDDPSPSYS